VRRSLGIALAAMLAAAMLAPTAASAGGVKFFQTLDGNIGCGMVKGQKKKKHKHPRFPGEARCDVKSHTWTAPPKPKFCDVDFGQGVAVGEKRTASYVCAGDTVAVPEAQLLAPGATIRAGRFTCSILATSVRCTNTLNGHGFEVSAIDVALF
jgi:hypothetical protein